MFSSIQSIPGLTFARSDVKAKIQPGVKARADLASSQAAGSVHDLGILFCMLSQHYQKR